MLQMVHRQSSKHGCEAPGKNYDKLRKQAEKFDWTDCKFPMALDKIKFFEKRNNISVNVYNGKECRSPENYQGRKTVSR